MVAHRETVAYILQMSSPQGLRAKVRQEVQSKNLELLRCSAQPVGRIVQRPKPASARSVSP